jgi:hypothetical protein
MRPSLERLSDRSQKGCRIDGAMQGHKRRERSCCSFPRNITRISNHYRQMGCHAVGPRRTSVSPMSQRDRGHVFRHVLSWADRMRGHADGIGAEFHPSRFVNMVSVVLGGKRLLEAGCEN